MTDRPILFSGPMVRALLDGMKTQTRRVLKPQPIFADSGWQVGNVVFPTGDDVRANTSLARYAIGDRLWVREHWRTWGCIDNVAPRDMQSGGLNQNRAAIWYEATPNRVQSVGPLKHEIGRHRQGMHMPRWASRITLIVEDVRVQRLQEISEADAEAEGAYPILVPPDGGGFPYVEGFRGLWDSLNAGRGYGWDSNPWVVAYTFAVERRNIDEVQS